MCALNFSFPAETSLTVTTIVIHVPVFGVSFLLLLYAVALASLNIRVMRDAMQLARWLVVLIGPLLIMVSLVADVVDMRELRCITDCRDNTPAPIYTAATACVVLLGWGSWLLAKGYQNRRRTTREYGAAGYMGVGIVLTDFFVEFLLGFQSLHYWPSS